MPQTQTDAHVLPQWVTLEEGAFLIGVPEKELEEWIAAARVTSTKIQRRSRGTPYYLVPTAELLNAFVVHEHSSEAGADTPTIDRPARRGKRDPAAEREGLAALLAEIELEAASRTEERDEPPPEPAEAPAAERQAVAREVVDRPRRATPLPTAQPSVSQPRQIAFSPRAIGAAIGVVSVALVVVLGLIAMNFLSSRGRAPARSGAPPIATTLAWAVQQDDNAHVAVLGVPPGGRPVAIAMPGDTLIDVPGGGPATISDAGSTPGLLVAGVQAALGRRVAHYLVSGETEFQGLIDALGGIDVEVQAPFAWDGGYVDAGSRHLGGAATLGYLSDATDFDRTSRWEDVLAGIIAAPANSPAWRVPLGESDDASIAQRVMVAARHADILELPTVPDASGGLRPDDKAIDDLLGARLPNTGGPLTRVFVLNGNGRAGMGGAVSALIAPAGFRVVAAQNASSFNVPETQIVAADQSLGLAAERVRALLGVGTVFLGDQPTGLADITILVGEDFSPRAADDSTSAKRRDADRKERSTKR